MNLTLTLNARQAARVQSALLTEIREDIRLRRHESTRNRIRECIALVREIQLSDLNLTRRALGLRPMTHFAEMRAWRLARRNRAVAQPLALAA